MDRLVLADKITMTEAETLLSINDVWDFGVVYDEWYAVTNPEPKGA